MQKKLYIYRKRVIKAKNMFAKVGTNNRISRACRVISPKYDNNNVFSVPVLGKSMVEKL